MHRFSIGLTTAAIAIVAGMHSAEAQTQREPRPYCMSGNKSNGGMPECSFHTWEQCRANLHGGADHCYANPALAWHRAQHGGQRKAKRTAY